MTQEYICNMCGETCSINIHMAGGGPPEDYSYRGQATGHYSSMCLDDMTCYRFRMCEYCMDWLFRRFKTPPTVSEYNMVSKGDFNFDILSTDNVEPFVPAAEKFLHGYQKDWPQDLKDEFFREYLKRTESRGEKISRKYYDMFSEQFERYKHNPIECELQVTRGEYHIGDYVTVQDMYNDDKKMYARVLFIKPGKDETWELMTLSKATYKEEIL